MLLGPLDIAALGRIEGSAVGVVDGREDCFNEGSSVGVGDRDEVGEREGLSLA